MEFLYINDCGVKDEWRPIELVLDDVIGLEVDFFKGKLGIFLRILFEPDDRRWLIEFEVDTVFGLKLSELKWFVWLGLAVVRKIKDFDFSLITEVLLEVESLWLSESVEFGEEELVVLPFGVEDGVWGDFIDFCDFLSWEVEFHDAFLLFDHQ